jgi:hypothetical protein
MAMSSNKSITSGIMDASITKQLNSMKLEIMTEIKKLLNQPTTGSNSDPSCSHCHLRIKVLPDRDKVWVQLWNQLDRLAIV